MATTEAKPLPSSIPLIVDQEFKSLIPSLTDEEKALLEANLIANGCRDPLAIWENCKGLTLLDGHNRLVICQARDIPYTLLAAPNIKSRDDAKLWILDNQAGRRNLNAYQRTRLALQRKQIIGTQAKERQREAGGAVVQKSGKPSIKTDKQIAKSAGVSHDTIHKVAKILDRADPNLIRQLERGEKSINEAYKRIRKEEEWDARDRLKEEAIVECPAGENVLTGNAHELLYTHLEDNSVPVIYTDPPWLSAGVKDGIYDKLGRLAARKLQPGGLLVCYCGKLHLDVAFRELARHLQYWWTFSIHLTGGGERMQNQRVLSYFRPLVAFGKPPVRPARMWLHDVCPGGGRQKKYHRWGQDVQSACHFIEHLSDDGHLVLEQNSGSGSFLVAAAMLKRNWLGVELDEGHAAIARKRIGEAVDVEN